MHPFSFATTAQILCESGASLRLAELCRERGAQRVLIVTDPGITRLGLLEPLLSGFARAGMGVQVFDQVLADPPESVVLAAVTQARDLSAELVVRLRRWQLDGRGQAGGTAGASRVWSGLERNLRRG